MKKSSKAEINEDKILRYLLAEDHPVGASKAAFFLAVGYTKERWTQLRDDLMAVAQSGQLVAEDRTQFGVKHVIEGVVSTPSGRMVELCTVWIADEPNGPFRLVTAYPS